MGRAKKRRSLAILLGALLFSILLLCWLYNQGIAREALQSIKNQQLDEEIVLLVAKLSRLEELDQELKQQQSRFEQQVKGQAELILLVQHLIFMANHTSDNLWLNSFTYHDHQVELMGESLFYKDILVFLQLLKRLIGFEKSQRMS